MSTITEPDILFRPRTLHTLPKRWCAGGGPRRFLSMDIPGTRMALCLMCGQFLRHWGEGVVRHEHNGTGVACPAHGPGHLAAAYEMRPATAPYFSESGEPFLVPDYTRPLPDLVCRYHRCDLRPHRFWLISPHGRGTS